MATENAKRYRYCGMPLKEFLALPPKLQEALTWASGQGRNWKKKVLTELDTLPERYRAFHWHPFGVQEWNYYTHIIRRYYAYKGEYDYRPCPYCAPDSGCQAQMM